MNTRYFCTPETMCNSGIAASFSSISPTEEDPTVVVVVGTRNTFSRTPTSSFLLRIAMRISRARWYNFLRRVFHYQNGSRSELGSNPFNSGTWMTIEFVALAVQVIITSYTLAVSKEERPVWPLRIWVSGYDFACVLSLMLLHWRYRLFLAAEPERLNLSDIEQQRSNNDESRSLHLMNKCRTSLDLFFAIWFVMGNIWVFDSRFGSFHRAPQLHVLCIFLLAWNAISYSFPFILFVLLCCCVPLASNLIGFNMNMGSVDRGASEDQISGLPSWRFEAEEEEEEEKEFGSNSALEDEIPECCVCLAKYKNKEEIRQLPCSHVFHLRCVDQWLRIISCCPLCKKDIEEER